MVNIQIDEVKLNSSELYDLLKYIVFTKNIKQPDKPEDDMDCFEEKINEYGERVYRVDVRKIIEKCIAKNIDVYEEGIKEAKKEVAKIMLGEGECNFDISKYTGLTEEEIENLE